MEAFEIMLLAILSAVLKCEWGLTSYEEAAITSVCWSAVGPRSLPADLMMFNRLSSLMVLYVYHLCSLFLSVS